MSRGRGRKAETGPAATGSKMSERAAREDRLAAALRDNLRRRKAQSRVRAEAEPPPSSDKSRD